MKEYRIQNTEYRIWSPYLRLTSFLFAGLFAFTFLLLPFFSVSAGPQSTTYELKEYGFGSGGTTGSDSTNYSLFGIAGEVDNGSLDSTSYTSKNGLTFTIVAAVPPTPTFTNPGSNYDRLKIVINNGNNPSDAKLAVAISSDNFSTDTRYVQSDFTVGSTLGAEDWLTYTGWGGASGVYITGLKENTTYTVKVAAKQGNFTNTAYGPTAQAVTSIPSLTFGIDSATITFTALSSSNSYTDSSKTTVLTTSTNAYNGYIVYGRNTGALTFPGSTIANYTSPNSAPTTWSGTGFGYTTDDSDLSGGTTNRFTSGGPKYAGFTTSAPGDPVADHTSPIITPISNEIFNIGYRVTAASTNKAGAYTTTVLYTVVPTY